MSRQWKDHVYSYVILCLGKIEENYGESEELTKSANEILRGVQANGRTHTTIDLSTSIQSAYQVASADYENNTAWGLKVSFVVNKNKHIKANNNLR